MATCYAMSSNAWADANWVDDPFGTPPVPLIPVAGDICYANGYTVDVNDAVAWAVAALSVLSLQSGGAFTITYAPTILVVCYTDPGKAKVVIGSDYKIAGFAQVAEYPTTAMSEAAGEVAGAAAQLVTDVAEVESKKGGVVVGTTILGVAGTSPPRGAMRAGRGF